jgi:uncharacterized SAM-binding protein YcdF (DUF218 family)
MLFYVLKVIESLILPPGLFILVLLAASAFLYRRSRLTGSVLCCLSILFYFLCTPLVGQWLTGRLESAYPQPSSPTGDVIVVLGAGFSAGTPDIDGQGNLTDHSAERLLTAARLYHQHHLPIILSGGPEVRVDGLATSEAAIGLRDLIGLGIPASEVIVEGRSRNTQENAKFTAVILKSHRFSQPILVTSAFHMERSVLDFQKVGVHVLPFPTDYEVSTVAEPYSLVWLPSADGLTSTQTALKEYVGLLGTRLGVSG